MKVHRRAAFQLLTTAAVLPAALPSVALAQATNPAEPALQTAREDLRSEAELIRRVKLARSDEPSFHFQA